MSIYAGLNFISANMKSFIFFFHPIGEIFAVFVQSFQTAF